MKNCGLERSWKIVPGNGGNNTEERKHRFRMLDRGRSIMKIEKHKCSTVNNTSSRPLSSTFSFRRPFCNSPINSRSIVDWDRAPSHNTNDSQVNTVLWTSRIVLIMCFRSRLHTAVTGYSGAQNDNFGMLNLTTSSKWWIPVLFGNAWLSGKAEKTKSRTGQFAVCNGKTCASHCGDNGMGCYSAWKQVASSLS